MDRNVPITSKHVLPKRSAKMIDGTEKPKIPLKFANHAARYNEYGYKNWGSQKIFLYTDTGIIIASETFPGAPTDCFL